MASVWDSFTQAAAGGVSNLTNAAFSWAADRIAPKPAPAAPAPAPAPTNAAALAATVPPTDRGVSQNAADRIGAAARAVPPAVWVAGGIGALLLVILLARR